MDVNDTHRFPRLTMVATYQATKLQFVLVASVVLASSILGCVFYVGTVY